MFWRKITAFGEKVENYFKHKIHMANPVLKIEITQDEVMLVAAGDLTAQHSGELRLFLLQNCDHSKKIHLAMDGATALDIAGIQLAYTWKSEVIKKGGDAVVTLPPSTNLFHLLEKASASKFF
jgi:anti-anti-sigma regulatory factor